MGKINGLPSIVQAVEFRRDQYGWTQKVMAMKLGWSPTHYSEFIHGKRNMPYKYMREAYRLGVPADCLFQVNTHSN